MLLKIGIAISRNDIPDRNSAIEIVESKRLVSSIKQREIRETEGNFVKFRDNMPRNFRHFKTKFSKTYLQLQFKWVLPFSAMRKYTNYSLNMVALTVMTVYEIHSFISFNTIKLIIETFECTRNGVFGRTNYNVCVLVYPNGYSCNTLNGICCSIYYSVYPQIDLNHIFISTV